MTDFVTARLKKIEDAIQTLPERPTAEQFIASPHLYSSLGEPDFTHAKTCLNDFMGYVISLFNQQKENMTDAQWIHILEIDKEFEDYFTYNLLPKLPEDYQESVIKDLDKSPLTSQNVLTAVAINFNYGLQMKMMMDVANRYYDLKYSLPNAKHYMNVIDRLDEISDDALFDIILQKEGAFIETLPSPPSPKKP